MNPGLPHHPAPPATAGSAKPAGAPGSGRSSRWTTALVVVIFVIGAAILYRLYSGSGEATSVAQDGASPTTPAVDATLRAVPPSSAPPDDVEAVSVAPAPLPAKAPANEEALAAEPVTSPAATEPSAPAEDAGAPPYSCPPAVAAVGLCN
ncbi:hypothetical protein PA01_07330 [Azoarcus sp. PA01]|nr:hypothetical protein PA01_07330 [Azoarcus sp. PA01]